jgi:hypothetical protein
MNAWTSSEIDAIVGLNGVLATNNVEAASSFTLGAPCTFNPSIFSSVDTSLASTFIDRVGTAASGPDQDPTNSCILQPIVVPSQCDSITNTSSFIVDGEPKEDFNIIPPPSQFERQDQ